MQVASRPVIPKEYGVPSTTHDLLPWSYVAGRMSAAKHYWLGTTSPGGMPHCRPIAGMWLDDVLYFGGSADTRWARNLAVCPKASIHLEDAEQAVMLEGVVGLVTPDHALAERIAAVSNAKYGQAQTVADYEGQKLGAFYPELVLAWKALYKDATRWHLDRRTEQ